MNAGRIETPAPPVRHIAVGEDAFEYVDVGRGPPVLFLHGAPGDWRMWRRHCAALSARFRAISYTQRYFGIVRWRADGPPFSTATHANDLVAFAEALGAGRPAVVAWSYVGYAVLQAALTRPDLFSAGCSSLSPALRATWPTRTSWPLSRAAHTRCSRRSWKPFKAVTTKRQSGVSSTLPAATTATSTANRSSAGQFSSTMRMRCHASSPRFLRRTSARRTSGDCACRSRSAGVRCRGMCSRSPRAPQRGPSLRAATPRYPEWDTSGRRRIRMASLRWLKNGSTKGSDTAAPSP